MLISFSSLIWAQKTIDYSEYYDLILTIEGCNARESF